MFGLSLSLPTLFGEGGGLMCESIGKTDLLSDHFESKQSMESLDLPLTCHPSSSHTTFAFSEVGRLLLNLIRPPWWHSPIGNVSSFSYENC